MSTNEKSVKSACYMTNLSMSIVGNLSPLLLLTFRGLYGISYSLLGLLVLINFCTQLLIDLVFSFYSHRFNIAKAVKLTPALSALGLLIYAVYPWLFPQSAYVGLALGTVIFAASGGLAEVLISPVIAAIPAEHPEREMSKLHSVYAWGVVAVVIVSTLFLKLFGRENWHWLALLWMLVPLYACVQFLRVKIPAMETPQTVSSVWKLIRNPRFLLCFFCILLGGASECTMAQWCSGYLEKALGIPKAWGDVLGVAMFAVMLGTGRTLFAKRGRSIHKVLLLGAAGAVLCYVAAAFSGVAAVGLIACVLTGFCTSMLWPGTLLVAADKFPASGVAVFALMAAGGDLGASIGPQLVGLVTDLTLQNPAAVSFAGGLHLSAEQLGMKLGMACAIVFPLIATILYAYLYKDKKYGEKKMEGLK
ncbi:MAG: MFS transporter [Clostridia bacterium]